MVNIYPQTPPLIRNHFLFILITCFFMYSAISSASGDTVRIFDSHCHLQDARIFNVAPQVIKEAIDTGVVYFAVDGVSEKDWHLVKEMSAQYPSIIPNFGVHPWFIANRSSNWIDILKGFLESTPTAAIGEIGLDKSSLAAHINYTDQLLVFRPQLQLAKELKIPASIHCLEAFDDLFDMLNSIGPFPHGFILHSFAGTADMVPELAKLGGYFSFSGWLMAMNESTAKKMLKAIPHDRILLETDAPDGLPTVILSGSLYLVPGDSTSKLNHPANIHHVLAYVAYLLDMPKDKLAKISFANAVRIFSYPGSKVSLKEADA